MWRNLETFRNLLEFILLYTLIFIPRQFYVELLCMSTDNLDFMFGSVNDNIKIYIMLEYYRDLLDDTTSKMGCIAM